MFTHHDPSFPEMDLPSQGLPFLEHDKVRGKLALCLSGGGFRAALFHLGALGRLNELGLLTRVDTIAAVSGGSIIAAYLATKTQQWLASGESIPQWECHFAKPFRDWVAESLRSKVLHNPSNWLTPTARVRALASQYDDFLGKSALRALPVRPNFIFCATDLGHGSPWHFERDLTGSEIEGWFANDDFTIGDAVAASSCFPPVFSPMILKLPQPVGKGSPGPLLIERALYWPDGQANAGHGYVDPRSIEPSREVGERLTSQELLSMSARGTRGAHARSKDTRGGTRSAPNPNQPTIVRRCNEPCTYLSDGGVSDNLGLEVVWRNHGVLLVSNGGQPFRYGWRNSHLRWVLRCTEVAGHQVDRLRVQWLLYLFRKCHRMGAYWGIGNTASSFGSSSQHWPTYSQTSVRNYISRVRTDLDRFTNEESKILENHGYCVAASAIDFHLLRHEPWRKELGISDYGNTNVPHPKLMATNFSDAESVQENDKLVRRHLENSHKRFGRGKPALSD